MSAGGQQHIALSPGALVDDRNGPDADAYCFPRVGGRAVLPTACRVADEAIQCAGCGKHMSFIASVRVDSRDRGARAPRVARSLTRPLGVPGRRRRRSRRASLPTGRALCTYSDVWRRDAAGARGLGGSFAGPKCRRRRWQTAKLTAEGKRRPQKSHRLSRLPRGDWEMGAWRMLSTSGISVRSCKSCSPAMARQQQRARSNETPSDESSDNNRNSEENGTARRRSMGGYPPFISSTRPTSRPRWVSTATTRKRRGTDGLTL